MKSSEVKSLFHRNISVHMTISVCFEGISDTLYALLIFQNIHVWVIAFTREIEGISRLKRVFV